MKYNLPGKPISTATVTTSASTLPTKNTFNLDFTTVLDDLKFIIEKEFLSSAENIKIFFFNNKEHSLKILYLIAICLLLVPIGIYLIFITILYRYSSLHKIIILIIVIVILFSIIKQLNKIKEKIAIKKIVKSNKINNEIKVILEKIIKVVNILIPIKFILIFLIFVYFIVSIYKIKKNKEIDLKEFTKYDISLFDISKINNPKKFFAFNNGNTNARLLVLYEKINEIELLLKKKN